MDEEEDGSVRRLLQAAWRGDVDECVALIAEGVSPSACVLERGRHRLLEHTQLRYGLDARVLGLHAARARGCTGARLCHDQGIG